MKEMYLKSLGYDWAKLSLDSVWAHTFYRKSERVVKRKLCARTTRRTRYCHKKFKKNV